MISSRVRWLLIFSALSASLVARSARAQDSAPAPLAESLSGEAKAAYESARLLFDDGDSPGALAKFSHAYEVAHDARLLWNMAVCEKELRHYARAASLIARYLQEGGSHISSEQRQSAVETKTALSAFYANLKLTGVPDGATVLVDGVKVGQAPLLAPLLVDLGPRIVRVEQPGFEPSANQIDVVGGGTLEVAVTLKRVRVPTLLPARLSVMTTGARDIVAVDGKVVGSQHWEGQVAIGEHVVRVTGGHKKPYESHVQLLAGSSRSLQITLEDETRPSNLWLWVSGSVAVAAGATVGGFLLLKPKDTAGAHPEGKLSTVYLSLGASR